MIEKSEVQFSKVEIYIVFYFQSPLKILSFQGFWPIYMFFKSRQDWTMCHTQSHYRKVPWWEIFMEQGLKFGLDLGRLALMRKQIWADNEQLLKPVFHVFMGKKIKTLKHPH